MGFTETATLETTGSNETFNVFPWPRSIVAVTEPVESKVPAPAVSEKSCTVKSSMPIGASMLPWHVAAQPTVTDGEFARPVAWETTLTVALCASGAVVG